MKSPFRKKAKRNDGTDRLLPKLSLFVFDRPRIAAIFWLCLTIFGVFSYTTFMKREGFPSIDIPYSVASGTYIANDPAKVDAKIAKPISDIALKDERVKSVQTQSRSTFYAVTIQYDEGVNAEKAGKDIQSRIEAAKFMPSQASLKVETPKMGFTERGDDAVVTLYAKQSGASLEDMTAEANKLADFIKQRNLTGVENVSVVEPYREGTDPVSGLIVKDQKNFDRYGVREDGQNAFYESVAVGVTQKKDSDVIELDDQLKSAVAAYNTQNADSKYEAVVSANYAHAIKDQIGELQKSLLEGLLAVLVIGSLVIAIRASIITVLAMITVLAITLGVLFTAGYSLNTITLFALILCLGLIVDDTIIMVEAIDAQRRKRKDARETVKVATQKVSRAMVAATLTAALSFAPLLFVGGILGGFIRAIPVTVITSLLVSLVVALVFIPLFARFLLLGKKQMGGENVHEPAAAIEEKIANFIGKPMLWARNSRKKLVGVGISAVLIGVGFIMAGGMIFKNVAFNIFPPSKDSNGLMVTLAFTPGTNIQQAEKATDKADDIISKTLGEDLVQASYYANADNQKAMLMIDISSYEKRDITAPQLVEKLENAFDGFDSAQVKVGQQDVGPPASAFTVRIVTDNRDAANKLANDLNQFLSGRELTRPSGEKAKIIETSVADPSTYSRNDGKMYLEVTANFDGDDTSTLVTLAKDAVNKEFTADKVASYGLNKDALQFDFGQEDENQESFAALALAFPVLLFAIYVLLAVQFRSLMQPLLIFMALPFSFFGIALGLDLTNNAFSFFAMLGFFALIGLSIKNSILLTDYANQMRRSGSSAVDAAVGALGERFRPLLATSLTAVVSLIPLAVTSPFWEGLAVVLIFGLLSSTLLVMTVFPYYYLGVEFLRTRISLKAGLTWFISTIVLAVLLSMAKLAWLIPFASIFVAIAEYLVISKKRRK